MYTVLGLTSIERVCTRHVAKLNYVTIVALQERVISFLLLSPLVASSGLVSSIFSCFQRTVRVRTVDVLYCRVRFTTGLLEAVAFTYIDRCVCTSTSFSSVHKSCRAGEKMTEKMPTSIIRLMERLRQIDLFTVQQFFCHRAVSAV